LEEDSEIEIRRVKQSRVKIGEAKTEAQVLQEIENFSKKKNEVREK
jgi:hypothetical protein